MPKVIALPIEAYKVLVSGGRGWTDRETILAELLTLPKRTVIIHGNASGADKLAGEVADELGLRPIPCPAHWKHNNAAWSLVHGLCGPDCAEAEGKAAGIIRNNWMLDIYKPDYLLAFHSDINESRGTKHCIKGARHRKIPGKLVGSNGMIVERW